MEPKIIRVWACCGVFGWTIPWPEWHLAGVYAQPPDDVDKPHVYVYSRAGQIFDYHAADVPDPLPYPCLGSVSIDDYIEPSGKVDWDMVLERVRSLTGD